MTKTNIQQQERAKKARSFCANSRQQKNPIFTYI